MFLYVSVIDLVLFLKCAILNPLDMDDVHVWYAFHCTLSEFIGFLYSDWHRSVLGRFLDFNGGGYL